VPAAARGIGACWGVIAEKYRLIIFGRYPFEEQWRPLVATLLMVAAAGGQLHAAFWKPWLVLLWIGGAGAFFALMGGGVRGLSPVETDRWGGLPLTMMLATLSIVVMAFPLAVVVALGRRSQPAGDPHICVHLRRADPRRAADQRAVHGQLHVPAVHAAGLTIDVLLRVLVGITLFAAAYMAEVMRGGLQAIPKGQVEAADTLGLSYWQTQRKIVLPQALAMVVPGIMNNFIGASSRTPRWSPSSACTS
jgi:general L-amino acid transport system permease protein